MDGKRLSKLHLLSETGTTITITEDGLAPHGLMFLHVEQPFIRKNWMASCCKSGCRLTLRKFLEVNDGIRKIIVTTKKKLGSVNIDGNTFLFIPSALYAYWVSKYLFEEKTNKILLPDA